MKQLTIFILASLITPALMITDYVTDKAEGKEYDLTDLISALILYVAFIFLGYASYQVVSHF